MDTGVYKIENICNGRVYIGSAVSLKKRWREHRRQLEAGNHHSRFMQRCYNKHGQDVFDFSVLLYCEREHLIDYEQRALDAFSPEYNTAPTAGSQLGYRHSTESRKRMSNSRRKDFSPFTGKSHTEETKRKISHSRKGKGNSGWTDERRRKISEAHKGRVITQEQREKISASLLGHKQTPEQIAKRQKNMPDMHYQRVAQQKTKLTDDQVRIARKLVAGGASQRQVALQFGVTSNVIGRIVRGLGYRWVS